MSTHFYRKIQGILSRTEVRGAPPPQTQQAKSPGSVPDPAERRQKWFAELAEKQILPLLTETAEALKSHGRQAKCWLGESDGHLSAELTIVPPDLPAGARAPRLSFYAGKDENPLVVEYTGTFPGVGASGGFGAEVDYDAIHSDLIEEKILDFVALATGA